MARQIEADGPIDMDPPLRVNRVVLDTGQPLPVYPRQRTWSVRSGRSVSCQQRKSQLYSITSSASASIAGGISIASNLAVLRLRQKSNLVGRSIGISPTLSPFKILSTK
jgi:hypothetical protein